MGTASGGFADNYLNSIAEVPTDWQIEGVGDFNGDGRADVLWRHESGALTNWLATEAGGFNANNSLMAQVPSDWRVLGTGDFDGDGMSDVLWRHEDGSLTNWLGQAARRLRCQQPVRSSPNRLARRSVLGRLQRRWI